MKQAFLLKTASKAALMLLFTTIGVACTEKNLYDENWRKSQLPSEDSYFDFALRGDIPLTVNYDAPGFQALIEIYDQNPLEEGTNVKKEGLVPVYKAYTNANGKLSAEMYIPTAIEEAYLYTTCFGLPKCVKLENDGKGFVYDATKSALTRASQGLRTDKLPFEVGESNTGGKRSDNLYSIVEWDLNGITLGKYMNRIDRIGNESLGDITNRVGTFLNNHNVNTTVAGNKDLIRNPEFLNVAIPENADGTKVNVTFVDDRGAHQSTFGYYYYPSNAPVTVANFLQQKKYVIFANASNDWSGQLKCGDTVNLLYFDDEGNASEEFPGGYTIGWFLIDDGYYAHSNGEARIKNINSLPYASGSFYPGRRNTCFSDEVMTANADPRNFITVYDEASKLYVVGIEDTMDGHKDDYMDLLFFVRTTPDLGAGELPSITDPTPKPQPQTETISGILSFEDIWPTGGDYDMNDVVVKYERVITFDADAEGRNYATQIEETFTPIHNGATFKNTFAYQVSNLGSITLSEGCMIENETKSIIIDRNVDEILNTSFRVTRKFNEGEITKDALKKDFNPFIIVHGYSTTDRIEVHLPKHLATSFANKDKQYTANDAYFIDKDGEYPFAIDIPYLEYHIPMVEGLRIDDSAVYPKFKNWAKSRGTENTDWYKHYAGKN